MTLSPHAAVLAQDLPTIYAYIAKDDPSAAERVLDAVQLTFDSLAQQPECGVPYPTRNPLLKMCGCCQSTIFRTTSSSTAANALPSMCSTSFMAHAISRDSSGASPEAERDCQRPAYGLLTVRRMKICALTPMGTLKVCVVPETMSVTACQFPVAKSARHSAP